MSYIISGPIIPYSTPNERPSLLKGVRHAKAATAFASPLPKQPGRQRHPRCFTCARGAAMSADIHPRQLWGGAVTPGTSAWTTRSLAGHVCPHRAACSPGRQIGASNRRGEREQQGVNRFTCQYEGNQLVVLRVLKNTYDDRRSSSTGEAGN